MANWFRVPAFVAGRLHGDHVATEYEAWTDLLGRWHMGEDVSACAFAEATMWGKGRVLKFMAKAAEWANEAGADLPKRWRADRSAVQDRTAHASNANKEQPAERESVGPESDRAPVQDRTASRARSSSERDQNRSDQMEQQILAPATADAVIDPEPVIPQKPKRTTSKASTGKDKPPPHPFHQRVIDAWDRCWKATHNDDRYPWGKSDVPTLVTCVRDPHVSREEIQGAADMQRVGAAMKRYLSQRVDGIYVKGLSVRGFCGDVVRWLTPVSDSPAPPRPNAPTPFVSIADMIAGLHQTSQPPPRTGVVIDIEEPN